MICRSSATSSCCFCAAAACSFASTASVSLRSCCFVGQRRLRNFGVVLREPLLRSEFGMMVEYNLDQLVGVTIADGDPLWLGGRLRSRLVVVLSVHRKNRCKSGKKD